MENVSRREFLEDLVLAGALFLFPQEQKPKFEKSFNINIPWPVDNPNYDYNKTDLDYIVNELKDNINSYYDKVRDLKNPSDELIFNLYSDIIIDLSNNIIRYGLEKKIPEFNEYAKKLLKKQEELTNKSLTNILIKYFDHFNLYFHFRMDDASLKNGNYMIYQAILAPIKKKRKDKFKKFEFNEFLLGERIIKQYKESDFSTSAAWNIENNIYFCKEVLKERSEDIWKFLSSDFSLKKEYDKEIDSRLEEIKEKLIEKEWGKKYTEIRDKYGIRIRKVKDEFIEEYIEKAKTSFRYHELCHMINEIEDNVANEVLAMYWQMSCGNKQYEDCDIRQCEDLAQVIEWTHMHKNSIYHFAGEKILNDFTAIIINSRNDPRFSKFDYSNVTGLNEESFKCIIPQLDKLNKEQITTIANTCIENKLYLK